MEHAPHSQPLAPFMPRTHTGAFGALVHYRYIFSALRQGGFLVVTIFEVQRGGDVDANEKKQILCVCLL